MPTNAPKFLWIDWTSRAPHSSTGRCGEPRLSRLGEQASSLPTDALKFFPGRRSRVATRQVAVRQTDLDDGMCPSGAMADA